MRRLRGNESKSKTGLGAGGLGIGEGLSCDGESGVAKGISHSSIVDLSREYALNREEAVPSPDVIDDRRSRVIVVVFGVSVAAISIS